MTSPLVDPASSLPPAAVRLVRVSVPLVRSHRSAHGTDDRRESVLVAWTRADGVTGWGECPTLATSGYATETTDAAWRALAVTLVPAALAGRATVAAGAVAATGALLDARLDAALRASGTSLAAHLGASRTAVPRTAVLADVGATPSEVAQHALDAVRDGAAMVKVKVAPGRDLDVVAAVRDAVDVPVAVDANGSYAAAGRAGSEDARALAELDAAGLAYLEQPLPAGTTWDELAGWRSRLATPLALDESLGSPDAVRSAVLAGAVDVVSVKPARLGGVSAAAAAVGVATAHGVGAFVGGMFELGIGRAAAAAVAALEGCTLPTDLGPSRRYVERDVCEPVVCDADGLLVVPDGPGCGRAPDPAALAEHAVEDLTLGA